jgi:hypothetical protein
MSDVQYYVLRKRRLSCQVMMEQGLRGEVLMDEVWVHAVGGCVGRTEDFLDLGGVVVMDEAFGHSDGKAIIPLVM